MLHSLVRFWFECVSKWGYTGVFFLMALESTVVPVPSEIVVPPAAFWAAQGQMSLVGVVLAGTLGSYFGSLVCYMLAQVLGGPLVSKFGRYVCLSKKKLKMAESWVTQFGTPGIFIARLLPIVRHLISVPAGFLKMSLLPFSIATISGAAVWCSVLAWFGISVIGSTPDLLDSPEAMTQALKEKMIWFVGAVICLTVLSGGVIWLKNRLLHKEAQTKDARFYV